MASMTFVTVAGLFPDPPRAPARSQTALPERRLAANRRRQRPQEVTLVALPYNRPGGPAITIEERQLRW